MKTHARESLVHANYDGRRRVELEKGKEAKLSPSDSLPKKHVFSLWLYLLIVFGFSWPFMIMSAIWANSLLQVFVLNASAMIMVTVGTFIAGRYVFRDGFVGAGWQWGKPKHYLTIIGFVMLLWVIPTSVIMALGIQKLGYLDGTQIIWVFVFLFVALIPGFGEEFGWRGYMLPHLARNMSERKAVLLHAIIWWAWHLPLVVDAAIKTNIAVGLSGGSLILEVSLALITGAIPSILHGVVFAYIWTGSRSLAVATAYHATFDGARDSLRVTGLYTPIVGSWATILLIILGIAFILKGDWKSLKEVKVEHRT